MPIESKFQSFLHFSLFKTKLYANLSTLNKHFCVQKKKKEIANKKFYKTKIETVVNVNTYMHLYNDKP